MMNYDSWKPLQFCQTWFKYIDAKLIAQVTATATRIELVAGAKAIDFAKTPH